MNPGSHTLKAGCGFIRRQPAGYDVSYYSLVTFNETHEVLEFDMAPNGSRITGWTDKWNLKNAISGKNSLPAPA